MPHLSTNMRYIESSFSIAGCRYGKYYLYHRYVLLIMICSGLMFANGAKQTIYYYCHPSHSVRSNLTDDISDLSRRQCRRWNEQERLYISYMSEAGFALVQIPTGICCDLYGAKHFFGIAILSTGFFSLLLPMLLPGMSFGIIMGFQFIQGCISGMATPGVWNLLARWAPAYQVTFLSSFHCSFTELGGVLAACIPAFFVMDSPQHSAPFFIWGILIVIWYVIFLNMVYSTMMDHPYISEKEREAVIDEIGRIKPQRIPWKQILKDSATWAIIAANAGDMALMITISTTSGDYIRAAMNTEGDDYAMYDLIRVVPELVFLVVFSYVADYLIQHNIIETVYLRSIYVCIGGMLSCILLLIAAYLRHYVWTAIILFWIGSVLTSFLLASIGVNVLDRTRNYCGFFTGITAAVQSGASFTRLLIVIVRRSPKRWANIFWFDVAVNFFTTVIYLKFSKGERAKWDVAETEEDLRVERLRKVEFRKFYEYHKHTLRHNVEIEPTSKTVAFAN